ncbi:hypothetical protein [Methanosphaera sp. WGK6]|uniref:hypothetical protein n=1 Tax=Methanosphaera sp. WGK6 TaxID=1561964 RepID=UPI00084C3072|nr:hypothetical protein [Methanosphaera sp. WGK6]OED30090.1 hypothetical protein NL43_05100 [Methanosphaera sp. WGK6]
MCAKHTMRVLSGMQPRQVDEMIDEYHLNMLQTDKGIILFEGELEDLRRATKHVVDVTLPPGPTVSEIKQAVDKFDVQLKQSDEGPQLHGTLYDVNDAINYIVDIMRERLDF